MGDPLDDIQEQMAYEPEESFSEEEEDKKIEYIDEFFEKNGDYKTQVQEKYERLASLGDAHTVALVFLRSLDMANTLVNKARQDGEDELADKWAKEYNRMLGLVDLNRLESDVNAGYEMPIQFGAKDQRMFMSVGYVRSSVNQHGRTMRAFVLNLFSGTDITAEGSGRSTGRGNRRRL